MMKLFGSASEAHEAVVAAVACDAAEPDAGVVGCELAAAVAVVEGGAGAGRVGSAVGSAMGSGRVSERRLRLLRAEVVDEAREGRVACCSEGAAAGAAAIISAASCADGRADDFATSSRRETDVGRDAGRDAAPPTERRSSSRDSSTLFLADRRRRMPACEDDDEAMPLRMDAATSRRSDVERDECDEWTERASNDATDGAYDDTDSA
jgi:hypothetical protein